MAAVSLFQQVRDLVLKNIKSSSINITDIISISKIAMEIVETYKISGLEKKQLVLDVISDIITSSGLMDQNQNEEALKFVREQLPMVIDLVVAASKNEVFINITRKTASKCCIIS